MHLIPKRLYQYWRYPLYIDVRWKELVLCNGVAAQDVSQSVYEMKSELKSVERDCVNPKLGLPLTTEYQDKFDRMISGSIAAQTGESVRQTDRRCSIREYEGTE